MRWYAMLKKAFRLRVVWLVFRKEMLETLRDRRTLAVTLLLPLCLYPLATVGIAQWVSVTHLGPKEEAKQQPTRALLSGPKWSAFEAALKGNNTIDARYSWGTHARLGHDFDVKVTIPRSVKKFSASDQQRTLDVHLSYDETNARSRHAKRHIATAIKAFATATVKQRLQARRLPDAFAKPIEIVTIDVSSKQQQLQQILVTALPLLLVLMVLLGAFYPAIELTAGEKERGTLETLFVAPAPRLSLIAGKFLVVATIAWVTGLVNLAGVGLTISAGLSSLGAKVSGLGATGWHIVAIAATTLLIIALFYAAVLIAFATFARSFKEGQSLLTPVYLVCLAPVIWGQAKALDLSYWNAWIPGLNVSLLAKSLFSQNTPLGCVLIALFSTTAYTAGMLAIAARLYQSERLLFASSAPLFAYNRESSGREAPTPIEASVLIVVVMTLIVVVGQPLQSASLAWGLIVTEVLLVALPPLAMARFTGLSFKRVFALRWPHPVSIVGAILCGVSGWFLIGVLIEHTQQQILPMPPEMIDMMRRALFSGQRSLGVDLLILAILPAICEELLFRGYLWQSTTGHTSTNKRILINALLFGAFHLSIYRFLPTTILAIPLSIFVLRTNSIVPGMVFHALNNGIAVLVGRTGASAMFENAIHPVWVAIAAIGFSVGLWLVYRSPVTRYTARR